MIIAGGWRDFMVYGLLVCGLLRCLLLDTFRVWLCALWFGVCCSFVTSATRRVVGWVGLLVLLWAVRLGGYFMVSCVLDCV